MYGTPQVVHHWFDILFIPPAAARDMGWSNSDDVEQPMDPFRLESHYHPLWNTGDAGLDNEKRDYDHGILRERSYTT